MTEKKVIIFQTVAAIIIVIAFGVQVKQTLSNTVIEIAEFITIISLGIKAYEK